MEQDTAGYWADEFDGAFRDLVEPVQQRVWRAVYGDEYPDGLSFYSYLSRTELRRCREELGVGAGDLLGDFGCGQGGPGLWLCDRTGADLVGVDISAVALETARANAKAQGLGSRAEFREGGFDGSDLGDGALDAVVSIDALLFAADKAAAIAELARVLRPGGRLVATTFDYRSRPPGRPPQVDDHRPLLAEAGFETLAYEETDQWWHRVTSVADGLLAACAEIAAESGEDPVQLAGELREMRATADHMLRRVLVVARRR